MIENPQQISLFLDRIFAYGPFWVYAALFAACFVENLFPPFPGDSFIVAAGSLVAIERLDLPLTFVLVLAGGVSSVMLLYLLGKSRGREYFVRKDFRYFSVADINRMERHFTRYGAFILLFSRFVVGMRVALAVGAGIGRYRTVPMLVYSTISYILFVSLLMYAGVKLVENLDRIEYYFTAYNWIAWPTVITLVVVYVIRKLLGFRQRRRQ